jgi:hypothetical protein
LACDATFYGKKRDKLGTLIFKDNDSREVVIWKHIESETRNDYIYLINELNKLGYSILSVVLDGKRGICTAWIPLRYMIKLLKTFLDKCVTFI